MKFSKIGKTVGLSRDFVFFRFSRQSSKKYFLMEEKL